MPTPRKTLRRGQIVLPVLAAVACCARAQDAERTSTPVHRPRPMAFGPTCDFVSVSAGETCSAGIDASGSLWTWGQSFSGQLANGSITETRVPLRVAGLPRPVKAVSIGGRHVLALLDDGTTWAWGDDPFGQLGDGDSRQRFAPAQVTRIPGEVVAIAAGDVHSLAVLADGRLLAWGGNWYGQLGDGTTRHYTRPEVIPSVTSAVSVAAGARRSLVLLADGTVLEWGEGTLEPGPVVGVAGATAIAAGTECVAVVAGGRLLSWSDDRAPTLLHDLAGVVEVATGGAHFLARRSDGTVVSWGLNSTGQLGDGTTASGTTPVLVAQARDCVSIAAGGAHSLAVRSDGSLLGWGLGNHGQLALPELTADVGLRPVRLEGDCPLDGILQVSIAYPTCLALRRDGAVLEWGISGQAPRVVPDVASVRQVDAASRLALVEDGTIISWADGDVEAVPGISDAIAFAWGGSHGLALLSDGTVRTWGTNYFGELGDGTSTPRPRPVTAAGVHDVVQVAAGGCFSLALHGDGTVTTWGRDVDGELASGVVRHHRAWPEPVQGLVNVVEICAGQYHALARLSDGRLMAWGFNGDGQLGIGTIDSAITSPRQVLVVSDAAGLGASSSCSAAVSADGSLWMWGRDFIHQSGSGDAIVEPMPFSGIANARSVSLVGGTALVRLADSTVWVFGRADDRVLGYNPSLPLLVPTFACSRTEVAPETGWPEVRGLALSNDVPGAPYLRRLAWIDSRSDYAAPLLFSVASGSLADLHRERGFASAECIASRLPFAAFTDAMRPGSRWYLVAMSTPCRGPTWGHSFVPGDLDPRAELAALAPCD